MVDATLDSNPPGTVRLICPKYASDYPPLMSAHEIGLRDMIETMILTGDLPEVHLIVVSAANLNEVNMELTPEVEASIPEVIKVIWGLDLIKETDAPGNKGHADNPRLQQFLYNHSTQ